MTIKPVLPSSLIDCVANHDNELIVVEGASAANAIKSVRNRQHHAVLPMQGKIPNANRTAVERLLAHPNIADLLQSLHPERQVEIGMDSCRYQRIIILADPDADGVHASILLLMFMLLHLPALIKQKRLYLVRAPLFGFYHGEERIAVAYSETHAAAVLSQLSGSGNKLIDKRRYKGIASLGSSHRLLLLAPDNPSRSNLSLDDCRQLCQGLRR